MTNMKIKHWAGYGSVKATVNKRSYNTRTKETVIEVIVEGDHEYGLIRGHSRAGDMGHDCYSQDQIRWLNKVVKDSVIEKGIELSGPDAYNFWNNINIKSEYLHGHDEETVMFTIDYNMNDLPRCVGGSF